MQHSIIRTTGLALMLAGCGGSDDGGSGSAPMNTAPSFTSSASATFAENATGTAYAAAANDAEGNALVFSISGGADAGLFQIAATGALSFKTPPDFDAPADADRNNIYEVTLTVSDGQSSATQALRVTVTDVAGGAFTVRRVGTGFASPVFLAAMPDGSGRVLVVERTGTVRLLNPATGATAPTPFLDLTGQVSTENERGLLGLALAPDYMTSGRAYVFITVADGTIELRRYTASATGKETVDPASADVLLSIAHPRSNHNGGWIGFDRAGLLYIATGDGGGANDPDMNGQNKSTLLGKILRLDVTRDDFSADNARDYGIPAANPFATGGGAPEVWLYGLRNPYRASFDRATGALWIGDVGQAEIEEIDRVQTTQTGLNLGWPLFEGTQPLAQNASPAGITMPAAQYGHGTGPLQGNSLTGGYVYRGPIETLQGLYIFADFISNNVWSVPIASLPAGTTAPSSGFTNRNADFRPNAGTLARITSFGEDQTGNLYIVTFGGDVFRIEPAG